MEIPNLVLAAENFEDFQCAATEKGVADVDTLEVDLGASESAALRNVVEGTVPTQDIELVVAGGIDGGDRPDLQLWTDLEVSPCIISLSVIKGEGHVHNVDVVIINAADDTLVGFGHRDFAVALRVAPKLSSERDAVVLIFELKEVRDGRLPLEGDGDQYSCIGVSRAGINIAEVTKRDDEALVPKLERGVAEQLSDLVLFATAVDAQSLQAGVLVHECPVGNSCKGHKSRG